MASLLFNSLSATLRPEQIPVVCLMGATATGKTDAAAQLFDAFDVEIVSVDSSLVYQHMNIGTAKPEPAFLRQYPHHLVDICHPNDTYSVAQFYRECCDLISNITKQGKIPVLAGGTMFYFNALEHGLAELPAANASLREELLTQANALGWPALHRRLATLDPDSAQRIDVMDTQRIQRALEIVMVSGKTVAQHNSQRKPGLSNPLIKLALCFSDRSVLHKRIEHRFDIMLEQGLKTEVENLLQLGADKTSVAMKMIGYRQMLEHLSGKTSQNEMRSQAVAATRQLAKRQLTWLRNQKNVVWWVDSGLENKNFEQLVRLIGHFLQ